MWNIKFKVDQMSHVSEIIFALKDKEKKTLKRIFKSVNLQPLNISNPTFEE